MNEVTLIYALGAAVIAYNLFATYRCIRSDYADRSQKYLQMGIVWIIPIIGAMIVIHFSGEMEGSPKRKTNEAGPDHSGHMGGAGSDSSSGD